MEDQVVYELDCECLSGIDFFDDFAKTLAQVKDQVII
jgi:hypothetical protein